MAILAEKIQEQIISVVRQNKKGKFVESFSPLTDEQILQASVCDICTMPFFRRFKSEVYESHKTLSSVVSPVVSERFIEIAYSQFDIPEDLNAWAKLGVSSDIYEPNPFLKLELLLTGKKPKRKEFSMTLGLPINTMQDCLAVCNYAETVAESFDDLMGLIARPMAKYLSNRKEKSRFYILLPEKTA